MMTLHTSLATLSDDELLHEVTRLATTERHATAALVRSLMELDARRLYLRDGCASLFTFCTQVLRLEEGAAYNRIEVARTARRFPAVLQWLEDGALTLTAVRLLAPHLTPANHDDVLASARHKSKREVERLVAARHPRPDAPGVIRTLPVTRGTGVRPPADVPVSPMRRTPVAAAVPDASPAAVPSIAPPRAAAPPRPAIAALAPDRYRMQLTIAGETHEKVRRAQDLLRHAIPDGDLATLFDRALTVLLQDLERRRFAATSSPRPGRVSAPDSRHIPAAVRREVWRRDGGQCAFMGRRGRCAERGFLEFHHVEPYAVGGAATVENVQLRCAAHNAHEASLFFGVHGAEPARDVDNGSV